MQCKPLPATPVPSPPAHRSSRVRDTRLTRRARRRRLLGLATLVVLIVAVATYALVRSGSDTENALRPAPTPSTTNVLTAPALGTATQQPFAADSVWNTALPDDVAPAANSKLLVDSFNQQWKDNYGTVNLNTDDYSIPIYRVPKDQATVAVSIRSECNADDGLTAQLRNVPIPPGARPADGMDSSLTVWQPSTDTSWELWRAQRADDGSWSTCWGGRTEHVSQSNGVFPYPYGVAATGMSYLGGATKVSELQAGVIDHALAVNVVKTSRGQVAPANRNDGDSDDADAIPEGTRFRLDPSVDIATLGLPKGGVAIAQALQKYGMYVTDKAGAVVLMGEDSSPYVAAGQPDPYQAVFDGQPAYEVLAKIPWDRMLVVPPPA